MRMAARNWSHVDQEEGQDLFKVELVPLEMEIMTSQFKTHFLFFF